MTKTYLISYDLGVPETSDSYKKLIEKIKSYGKRATPLKSVWFIQTTMTISQVRDGLLSFIDNNDKLLVIDITNDNWATYGIIPTVTDRMNTNI